MVESKEEIIELFRENGFRATPQRVAIAQFVLNCRDHPTAEQVFEFVKRAFPSISISTVYNTLNAMSSVNMIQEFALGNIHRYDPNTSIHVNLVCVNCGEIVDVESKTIEEEVDNISKSTSIAITGHRFDLYGICQNCKVTEK